MTVPDPESGKEGKTANRAALRHERRCTFDSPILSLFLASSGFPVHAYLTKDSPKIQGDGKVVFQRQSTSYILNSNSSTTNEAAQRCFQSSPAFQ